MNEIIRRVEQVGVAAVVLPSAAAISLLGWMGGWVGQDCRFEGLGRRVNFVWLAADRAIEAGGCRVFFAEMVSQRSI